MNRPPLITRREFLETSAGAVLVTLQPREAQPGSSSDSRRNLYQIFSEGHIAGLKLKNRLVRAATAEGAIINGEVSDEWINTYRALADGGVGLIITGAMSVVPSGRAGEAFAFTLISEDRLMASIRRIADGIHQTSNGCKVIAQLFHPGAQGGQPVAPSARSWPWNKDKPHVLTTREVEEIVVRFAQAARRAREAGFDGVEIHAAHGYLLSSFLSPYSNARTDRYGGNMERRVSIIHEIVEQMRAQAGRDLTMLIKMNCDDTVKGGINIETFPELATEIEKTGVHALEVSANNFARQQTAGPDQQPYFLKYIQKLELRVPLILTGGNRSVERLEMTMKSGEPDFFGLARPLLREPDLPNRWFEGRGGEESTCISCNRCLHGFAKGKVTRCRVGETDA